LELGFEVWEVVDFAVEDEGILFVGAAEGLMTASIQIEDTQTRKAQVEVVMLPDALVVRAPMMQHGGHLLSEGMVPASPEASNPTHNSGGLSDTEQR
jgi:hypothetical protein